MLGPSTTILDTAPLLNETRVQGRFTCQSLSKHETCGSEVALSALKLGGLVARLNVAQLAQQGGGAAAGEGHCDNAQNPRRHLPH